MEQTTELAEVPKSNFFQSKDLFEHAQRVALMLSKSDLLPEKYKGNVGNCVIALEMAYRMGASPLMIMQNLNIILGTPAWSSKFLIACINSCGKFSPLRYEEDEKDGGRTRAYAIDLKTNEKLYGVWVTMAMAEAEGWTKKNGSKWKTMPELMRRYRAASFFTNQYAPELSMGFKTEDEIIDITPVTTTIDKEHERITLMLSDAKTLKALLELKSQVPPEYIDLYNDRWNELNEQAK